MLRALTIIFVVISLAFVVWAYLAMTGVNDWIATAMAPAKTEEPANVAAKTDAPKDQASSKTQAEPEPAPAQMMDADTQPPAEKEAAATDAASGSVDPAGNPEETAKAAELGTLINPYQDDVATVAEEGRKIYMAAGCNGCHGGTGGGGMGPPLTNPVWVYGNDGDTMFRLISLGTKGIEEQGYTRQRSELVKGPMPPFGNIVKSNDDLWKLISWIWSVNTYTKPGDKPYPKPGDSASTSP